MEVGPNIKKEVKAEMAEQVRRSLDASQRALATSLDLSIDHLEDSLEAVVKTLRSRREENEELMRSGELARRLDYACELKFLKGYVENALAQAQATEEQGRLFRVALGVVESVASFK